MAIDVITKIKTGEVYKNGTKIVGCSQTGVVSKNGPVLNIQPSEEQIYNEYKTRFDDTNYFST